MNNPQPQFCSTGYHFKIAKTPAIIRSQEARRRVVSPSGVANPENRQLNFFLSPYLNQATS
jgi:hypothetical protein